MRYHTIIFKALLIIFVMNGLSACYSPTEGCLDPESTNYDIDGDDQCDDCCIYPTIKVSVFHQNADTTFELGDTLVNNLGQEYSIIKYVYLLSDFVITDTEGKHHEVIDTVQILTEDDSEWVKDDVVRVSRSTFSYEFGTIVFDGTADQVSFQVGLSAALDQNRFATAIERHPLTSDPDSLYNELTNEFTYVRMQVAQGVDLMDTVIYDVKGLSNVQQISFPIDFESQRGKNKTMIIEARYNEWLQDADFESMTAEMIESQIASKTSGIFKAKE